MHVTCTCSYTEQDRYPQGGNTDIAFRLYHWHMMDMFIYFRYLLKCFHAVAQHCSIARQGNNAVSFTILVQPSFGDDSTRVLHQRGACTRRPCTGVALSSHWSQQKHENYKAEIIMSGFDQHRDICS
jgi:hypothetical protein